MQTAMRRQILAATHKKEAALEPAPEIWSRRSQASLRKEYGLREERRKFEALISGEDRRIGELEKDRERQARLVASGQNIYHAALTATLGELCQRREKVKAYRDTLAQINKELAGLEPTPKEAAARAQRQAEIARLARQRVKDDGGIDNAIDHLRKLLKDRAETTRRMVVLAREVEFTGHDFDEARFDNLLRSLPAALRPESLRWLEWFTGANAGRSQVIIRKATFELPETLACPGFFVEGDTALLTDSERAKAEYEPPRPMTPMEAERLYSNPKPKDGIEPKFMPGSGILGP